MTGSKAALALAASFAIGPVHAADPTVPIGQDPGGGAVAVLGTGIDYTRPEIAARLARDGEGEIIAWDFADGDHRPFDGSGASFANRVAATLAASGKVRLIPVRIDTGDKAWLGRASAFVARTPASTVVAEIDAAAAATQAEQLAEIARLLARISIVLVTGAEASPQLKAASAGLANIALLSADYCTGSGGARAAVTQVGTLLCASAFKFAD